MKNRRLSYISIIMVLAFMMAIFYTGNYYSCPQKYRDDVNLVVNGQTVKAEIAQTEGARQKGLGERECIKSDQGMLFVFQTPGYYPFWMKDMEFPIDMVWINASKKVVDIQPNVSPSTYPKSFVNSTPAQYVLELRAGSAGRLGLTRGSTINF